MWMTALCLHKRWMRFCSKSELFADARKKLAKKLGLYTRIAMKIFYDKRRAIPLHIKCSYSMAFLQIGKCTTPCTDLWLKPIR